MKVKLVFDDWRKQGTVGSIYNTVKGIDLSLGNFHSGTTFRAVLALSDKADEAELAEALAAGYHPVFTVIAEKEG